MTNLTAKLGEIDDIEHNKGSQIYPRNQVITFVLFEFILYVPSTIFQLHRDGSSWVEPVLSYDKCVLLKDHNAVTPVWLEPAAPRSLVEHSTTEPLNLDYIMPTIPPKHNCLSIILIWVIVSHK